MGQYPKREIFLPNLACKVPVVVPQEYMLLGAE